jgi:hypothetical protein
VGPEEIVATDATTVFSGASWTTAALAGEAVADSARLPHAADDRASAATPAAASERRRK